MYKVFNILRTFVAANESIEALEASVVEPSETFVKQALVDEARECQGLSAVLGPLLSSNT
jgi:hypothetical protein